MDDPAYHYARRVYLSGRWIGVQWVRGFPQHDSISTDVAIRHMEYKFGDPERLRANVRTGDMVGCYRFDTARGVYWSTVL